MTKLSLLHVFVWIIIKTYIIKPTEKQAAFLIHLFYFLNCVCRIATLATAYYMTQRSVTACLGRCDNQDMCLCGLVELPRNW